MATVDTANHTVWYYSWLTTTTGFNDGDTAVVALFNSLSLDQLVIRRIFQYDGGTAVHSDAQAVPWLIGNGQSGPDVLMPYDYRISSKEFSEYFRPLTHIWEAANLTARVLPEVARFCRSTLTGEYLLVPRTAENSHLQYRTDELAAMGLPPPETWADLLEVCARFRASGRPCISHRRARDEGLWQFLDLVFASLQGPDALRRFQAGDVAFTDPTFRVVGEQIALLGSLGYIDFDGRRADKPAGWTSNHLDFVFRRVGMIVGIDLVRQFIANETDMRLVAATPWPRVRASDRPVSAIIIAVGLAIPRSAHNVAGASAFIAATVEPSSLIAYINGSTRAPLPLTVDPYAVPRISSDPVRLKLWQIMQEAPAVIPSTFTNYALTRTKDAVTATGNPMVAWLFAAAVRTVNESMAAWDTMTRDFEALRLEEKFGLTDTPQFSLGSGTYGGPIVVTLRCATVNASVYYRIESASSGMRNTSRAEPFTMIAPDTELRVYAEGETVVVSAYASRPLLKPSSRIDTRYTFPARVVPASRNHRSVVERPWFGGMLTAIMVLLICIGLAAVLVTLRRRRHKVMSNELRIEHETTVLPEEVFIFRQIAASGVFEGEYRGTAVAVKALGVNGEVLRPDERLQGCTLALILKRLTLGELTPRRPALSPADFTKTNASSDLPRIKGRQLQLIGDSGGSIGHSNARGAAQESFIAESKVLCLLRHPNIVLALGIVHRPRICIVIEYMPRGSLFIVLRKALEGQELAVTSELTFAWAVQVSSGLAFLHASGIVHGDLKSPNVLISNEWTAKIADFGTVFKKELTLDGRAGADGVQQTAEQREALGFSLSAAWSAPELLDGSPLTAAVDIYSFGIVCWELLTLQRPYANVLNYMAIVFGVAKGKLRPDLELVEVGLRAQVTPFLRTLWSQHPLRRPSADAVVLSLASLSSWAELSGAKLAGLVAAPSMEPTPRVSAPDSSSLTQQQQLPVPAPRRLNADSSCDDTSSVGTSFRSQGRSTSASSTEAGTSSTSSAESSL